MKKGTVRISELGAKRAISTGTGEELGRIRDVEIDVESGTVTDAVVVRRRGILGIFKGEERHVLWKEICLVGEDTVLVNSEWVNGSGEGKKRKAFGLFE